MSEAFLSVNDIAMSLRHVETTNINVRFANVENSAEAEHIYNCQSEAAITVVNVVEDTLRRPRFVVSLRNTMCNAAKVSNLTKGKKTIFFMPSYITPTMSDRAPGWRRFGGSQQRTTAKFARLC